MQKNHAVRVNISRCAVAGAARLRYIDTTIFLNPIRNVQLSMIHNQKIEYPTLPSRRPLVGLAKHYHVLFAKSPGWGFWVSETTKCSDAKQVVSQVQLPKGVLKIKKGYNPNSSSIGTVIYSFPFAFIALSAICAFLVALIKPRTKSDNEIPDTNTATTHSDQ